MFVDCEEERDIEDIKGLLEHNKLVIAITVSPSRIAQINNAFSTCPVNLSPLLATTESQCLWANIFMLGFNSIETWIASNPNPSNDIVIRVVYQIFRGYASVHSVSHGELKWSNIFISDEGTVMLGPLGEHTDNTNEVRELAYLVMQLMARTGCTSRILRGIVVHMLCHPTNYDFDALLEHELFDRIGAPQDLRRSDIELTEVCNIIGQKFSAPQSKKSVEILSAPVSHSKRSSSMVSRAFQFFTSKFTS